MQLVVVGGIISATGDGGRGSQRHWQENTLGAMLASPANPTGTALTREELQAVSRAVRRRT